MNKLEHSDNFPYVLGVFQSKIQRGFNKNCLAITEQDRGLAKKIKEVLEESLEREIYESTVKYSEDRVIKHKKRIVVWNKALMDYIKSITNNNRDIPKFFNYEQEENYIRGWFDSRASVCFTPYKITPLDYTLKYPKLIITKSTNPELLKNLKHFLLSIFHIIPTRGYLIGCFVDNKKQNGFSLKRNSSDYASKRSVNAIENGILSNIPFLNMLYNLMDSKTNNYMSKISVTMMLEDHGFKVMNMTEQNRVTYFCARRIINEENR